MSTPQYLVRGGDGRDYPADLVALRAWAAEGRLRPAQYVFDTHENRWISASEIPELLPLFAGSKPTSNINMASSDSGVHSTRLGFIVGAILVFIIVTIIAAASRKQERKRQHASSDAVAATPYSPPQPISSISREASLNELVRGLAPLFDGYTVVGPVSVRMQLNPAVWNGMSGDQQQQIGDMLASKQIVRDIGCTLHLYVYETEIGTIGPGWSGDWRFRRN